MKLGTSTLMLIFLLLFALPVNATTKYLSIPGSAFLPIDEAQFYDRIGTDLEHHGPAEGVYYAPLYLPDGAQLRSFGLGASLCGPCANCSVTVQILERDMVTNDTRALRTLELDKALCTLVTDNPMFSPTYIVDNQTKAYFVYIQGLEGGEFNADRVVLRWVRIEYYLSAAFVP